MNDEEDATDNGRVKADVSPREANDSHHSNGEGRVSPQMKALLELLFSGDTVAIQRAYNELSVAEKLNSRLVELVKQAKGPPRVSLAKPNTRDKAHAETKEQQRIREEDDRYEDMRRRRHRIDLKLDAEWAAEGEAPFAFRPLREYAREVDAAGPAKWLFENVIVEGDYGVLSAEDKAGKTWGMVDAAVSCASGLPWLSQFECQVPGTVISFFGEGSKRKFVRRTRAVAASKGLSREVADELDIFPVFRCPQLSSGVHRELIREALAEHTPKLVIIDPLYLAAKGAKGSDLFNMGELLGDIQHIIQDSGASLLVSHHWKKGGSGDGHDRSSGVGPGAWGRFLISVGVKARHTDRETKETTVTQKWSLRGDEIPDSELVLIRKVREETPGDLSSPMHYSVILSDLPDEDDDDGVRLKPAEKKVREALTDTPSVISEITDRVARQHGHGLYRTTVSSALNRLRDLSLASDDTPLPGMEKKWRRHPT
jgi:AAA domain-containing protein